MFKQLIAVFCAYALLTAQAAPSFAQLSKSGSQIIKAASETGVTAAKEAAAARVGSGALKGISPAVNSVGAAVPSAARVPSAVGSSAYQPRSGAGKKSLSASSVERLKRLLAIRTPSVTKEEIHIFVQQGDLATPLRRIFSSGIVAEESFVLGQYLKTYSAAGRVKETVNAIKALLSHDIAWSEGVVRATLSTNPQASAAVREFFTNPQALADANLRGELVGWVSEAFTAELKKLPPSLQEELLQGLEKEFTETAAYPVKPGQTFKSPQELKKEERWALLVLWALAGGMAAFMLVQASSK